VKIKISKRTFAYLIIPFVLVAMIIIQQQRVIKERSQNIISTYGQWQQNGKPVTVYKAESADVKEYIRLTLESISANKANAFLSLEQKKLLKPGQAVFLDGQGEKKAGVVSQISDEPDRQTAMFAVTVKLESELKGTPNLVFVNVNTYPGVISVPNEILDKEDDEYFVWKAVNGHAVRSKVGLFSRDGYGTIISSGISEGDMIIYTGQSQLEEGDKLNMIEEIG
jgi:hypothetical protein